MCCQAHLYVYILCTILRLRHCIQYTHCTETRTHTHTHTHAHTDSTQIYIKTHYHCPHNYSTQCMFVHVSNQATVGIGNCQHCKFQVMTTKCASHEVFVLCNGIENANNTSCATWALVEAGRSNQMQV